MYQGIFDTDFDKYTEDAVALFGKYGINTVFENLEGFPEDWKTNAPAFVNFVREHQRPSFLEYGEYPYVSAEEIKKALRLKAAFSDALDQKQSAGARAACSSSTTSYIFSLPVCRHSRGATSSCPSRAPPRVATGWLRSVRRCSRPPRSEPGLPRTLAGSPSHAPGTGCARSGWTRSPSPVFPRSSSREWRRGPRCWGTPG